MVKKDAIYKWEKRGKDAFSCIKQFIVEASTFYNSDFNKDFMLYTFASYTSLVIVLTQKDDQNNEHPISFMSDRLQGPKINYPTIHK